MTSLILSSLDRHCERSEAIQLASQQQRKLDCFVAALLAMTISPRRNTLHRRLPFRIRDPHVHAAAAVVAGIDREFAAFKQGLQAAIDEFLRRLAAMQLGRELDDERRLQRAVED